MAAKTLIAKLSSKTLNRNDSTVMLYLYGTSACHLCEQASALLISLEEELHFDWSEIDIAEDGKLIQRYSVKIPVLYRPDNNTELCWPFSVADIRDFLSQ